MQQQKHTHTALKFFLILIFLGVVVGILYLRSIGTDLADFVLAYQSDSIVTEIIDTIEYDTDSKSSFAIIKNDYVHCTKDGVKYNGGAKWNETYTIDKPTMISEGNIVAVCEFNNKAIYVFNEKGKMYSQTTQAPIVQFALNKSGYLAVITKENGKYDIYLYNPNGDIVTARMSGNDENEKGIFPIAVDISEDGKCMAISYLETSDTIYRSKILFIGIGREAELENSDSLISGIHKDNEIIFSLSYKGDTLIAVSDKSILAIDSTLKEKWSINLTNEIAALDFSNEKNIVVAFGDKLPVQNSFEPNTVVWYDLSGKQLSEYTLDSPIYMLTSKDNRALVYSSNSIYAVNKGGKLLWEHIILHDLNQMLMFDNLSTMLLCYKNSAQIIDIRPRIIKPKEDKILDEGDDELNELDQNSTSNSTENIEQSSEASTSEVSSTEDSTDNTGIIQETSEQDAETAATETTTD